MKMNRILYILTLTLAGSVLSSCIGDLNTTPLNETDIIADNVYGAERGAYLEGLTKIYFQFVSNDTKDLEVADGGASELIRAFWSAQETTTDEAKCAWNNDAWVRALNTNTYSEAQNDATYAVYVRTIQGITFANEYLRLTSPELLAERKVAEDLKKEIESFRAEARFLRAYFYWMAMDTFGDVPFTTEKDVLGMDYRPTQKLRKDIFKYVTDELEDLLKEDSAMPAPRSNYPRADKGAVAGLLARLYLNAEVYTSPVDLTDPAPGIPMWAEAKAACEKLFDMGYELCDEYAHLFRGDNGENPEARKELIFTAGYDADFTRSYGGTTYLLFASLAADEVSAKSMPTGVNTGWAGLRMPYDFVSQYFAPKNKNYTTGSYLISDKRGAGMFNIKGRTESMGPDYLYEFSHGWACWKFNNIPSTETEESFREQAKKKSYSDIDYPLIRLGEIYLIYAEACMNLNEGLDQAQVKIDELSDRADVEAPNNITKDWLVRERARELYWEGHRRTDLIRYGLYNTKDFNWPFKGTDAFKGTDIPQYKNVFAIPPTELASNTALYQNYGYPNAK